MASLLICTQCGHVGKSVYVTKGSMLAEAGLWLFFLLPGLIYSVWRLSSKTSVCAQCKNPSLIPLDSPNARKVLESTGQSLKDFNKVATEDKTVELKRRKTRKVLKWVLIATVLIVIVLIYR